MKYLVDHSAWQYDPKTGVVTGHVLACNIFANLHHPDKDWVWVRDYSAPYNSRKVKKGDCLLVDDNGKPILCPITGWFLLNPPSEPSIAQR